MNLNDIESKLKVELGKRAIAAEILEDHKIDLAAGAGYAAFASGGEVPAWVLLDQMLVDAWRCGRRQAARHAARQQARKQAAVV